ncbi:MAG: hypothetical protein ACR652_24500 [Methylocystis sp.]|uniref:hypothetical protein n=1 Tax=Methylocystis sp. TaxID=1911079 RepID=UPI003DA50226
MADMLLENRVAGLAERIDRGDYMSRDLLRDLAYTTRVLFAQRRVLAKLAAETPQFSNPLEVYAAQELRDEILAPIPAPTEDANG